MANAALVASVLAVPAYSGGAEPSLIQGANASLVSGAHYTESLTGFSNGIVDNSGIDEALNFVAPEVPAGRKFEYKRQEARADFEVDADDRREIGQDFKETKTHNDLVLGQVHNRGLTTVIDEDEFEADENAEEAAVMRLIKRLKRNELIRAIALMDAAAVNTNRVWSPTPGIDPQQDLQLSLSQGADASGRIANRVFWGERAWIRRTTAHRAQDNAGGYASAGLNVQAATAEAGAEEGMMNSSRFDDDGVLSQIVGDAVYSFTALPGQTRQDSSNIKRFVYQRNGQRYRVHRMEISAKLVRITVEHYSETYITSTLGIRKETIAGA